MNPNLSSFLNLSRWLAAFLVVIAHVRHLILVDFKDVEQKTLFNKALYFVTGFGHEAVVIFFVISGFLVGALTLKRWQRSGPDLGAYASARISRIYTVLIPALLVGLALDMVGLHWFNASELYTNSAKYHTVSLNNVISSGMDWRTLVGNVFMLENIVVGTLGSNAPLWSLAYEWWYYCIFALVGVAVTGVGKQRVVCAVTALVIAVLLPPKLMLWGTIWLLGIAAHHWIATGVRRPHPLVGFGVLVIAFSASRLSHNVDNVAHKETLVVAVSRDFGLGVAYVIALASASRMKAAIYLPRMNEWLAEFSYTTYLTHFPAMIFVVAVGYQVLALQFLVQPSAAGWLYFFGATGLVYVYCFVFAQLTERHTGVIRVKLDSYLKN